jgi:hypothetical protein
LTQDTPGFSSAGAAQLKPRYRRRSSLIRQIGRTRTARGASYTASAWVRARTGRTVCLRLRETRTRGAVEQCEPARRRWQEIALAYTARRDGHRLVFSVRQLKTRSTSAYRVDRVHLKKVRETQQPPSSDVVDPDEGYGVGNWPTASWRPYADSSPWNTSLDTSDVAEGSATMIQRLVDDGPPAVSTFNARTNWGYPLYFGRSSDAQYAIEASDSAQVSRSVDGAQVHLPAGAVPNQGSDGVMRIVDQPSGFMYHLQRCTVDDSARTVSCWRATRRPIEGSAFRTDVSADVAPGTASPIRPEELAAGEVNHTMLMFATCLSGHPVAPMDEFLTVGKTCSGDSTASSTRLSIGNVVFVDMSDAQIEALAIPNWQKALLKGLANHGAVVVGNGAAAWSLIFESHLDRTAFGLPDPYAASGLPSTLDFSDALDSVGGWPAKLRVLAPFPRPCSGVCP